MSETSVVRPGQVTVAGWVVVVASVVVVVSVFDQLGSINTVETRAGVEDFLSRPPGDGLGIGVDTVIGLLRASAYVAALCAAASAILGWFVLRRDRVARLVLTVLAVPLFLSGLASGAFFPAIVAGSTLLLWAQPARYWFDGRTPPPVSTPTATPTTPTTTPPPPAPVLKPTSDQPRPHSGWGTSSATLPPEQRTPAMLMVRRPEPILWSCLVTWSFSGIAFVGLLLSGVLLLGEGTAVIAEARAQAPELAGAGISDQALLYGVLVVVAGFAVWAVAAIVLATLVWRGRTWARITLAVSAGLAAGVGLLTMIGGQLYVVPLVVGCVVVVRLLLSRRAADWCRQQSTPSGHQVGGGQPL